MKIKIEIDNALAKGEAILFCCPDDFEKWDKATKHLKVKDGNRQIKDKT